MDFAIFLYTYFRGVSILGAINMITNLPEHACPGMDVVQGAAVSAGRSYAILQARHPLSLPVLAGAVTHGLLDGPATLIRRSYPDGRLAIRPVVYPKHILWFFGHPEVYIIIPRVWIIRPRHCGLQAASLFSALSSNGLVGAMQNRHIGGRSASCLRHTTLYTVGLLSLFHVWRQLVYRLLHTLLG